QRDLPTVAPEQRGRLRQLVAAALVRSLDDKKCQHGLIVTCPRTFVTFTVRSSPLRGAVVIGTAHRPIACCARGERAQSGTAPMRSGPDLWRPTPGTIQCPADVELLLSITIFLAFGIAFVLLS